MPKPSHIIHFIDDKAGIRRKRAGRSFVYVSPRGARVRDPRTLKRIRSLVIPPAWTDVWISPLPNAHLQATGRDARGRKQYRYHAAFRALREAQKFDHLAAFAQSLPRIRKAVAAHMALPGLPREKIIATVIHLLEVTHIRIGNEDYARQNHSYGLTTLRNPHVDIAGNALRFHFKGKSGKTWRVKLTDRRVAKIVKACQELPGQHLFQYCDEQGHAHEITSTDVNAYLQDVTGGPITAKEFRTWTATVLAASILRQQTFETDTEAKRLVKTAIAEVANRLGNTITICRKCYVHPRIIETFLSGHLASKLGRKGGGENAKLTLDPEEAAVLAFLRPMPSHSRKMGGLPQVKAIA